MALGAHKLRIAAIAILIVSGAAGAVWGARYWSERRAKEDALAKLTQGDADAVRQGLLAVSKEDLSGEDAAGRRRAAMENMRRMGFEESMKLWRDSDNLTEEQRKQLRENMGEVMQGHFNDLADEYMKAPKEEKDNLLDRQIDEWMKLRKEMEAYREKHKDDPEQKEREERFRQQGPRRDTQEAKQRMEGGNPDQQAKMVYYMTQLRKRADARGLDMGGPRGGRGFGWWGGGRGAGGGPRGGGSSGGEGGRGRP